MPCMAFLFPILIMHFPGKLQKLIEARRQQGSYRQLHVSPGLVDFCSNDYLGFARSKELISIKERIHSGTDQKNGSTGSRLISGNTAYAEELEKKLAGFHHAESALLFNSGYDANLGLLSCIPQKNDLVLFDELSHASIYDGIRLSFARHYKFRHNDTAHLRELIDRHGIEAENIYIVVESVYSMDGDAAPLNEITQLLSEKCFLIVDEAHATGVFGEQGKGLCQQEAMENKCFARVITFGKALGTHGAVVVGSTKLRDFLVNFARSFIYTTALPVESLKSIDAAYRLLTGTKENILLHANIECFIELTKGAVNRIPSNSAIQSILVESNTLVDEKARLLQEAGFGVKAIKSPTVAAGKERIRICLHSFNTQEEIGKLVELLISYGIMKF